jgi:hypothetical protein
VDERAFDLRAGSNATEFPKFFYLGPDGGHPFGNQNAPGDVFAFNGLVLQDLTLELTTPSGDSTAKVGDTVTVHDVASIYASKVFDRNGEAVSLVVNPHAVASEPTEHQYAVYALSSSVPEDIVDQEAGSVTFTHASEHVITASVTNQGVTKTASQAIEVSENAPTPAPEPPVPPAHPGTATGATAGTAPALTGVPGALYLVLLLGLLGVSLAIRRAQGKC